MDITCLDNATQQKLKFLFDLKQNKRYLSDVALYLDHIFLGTRMSDYDKKTGEVLNELGFKTDYSWIIKNISSLKKYEYNVLVANTIEEYKEYEVVRFGYFQ